MMIRVTMSGVGETRIQAAFPYDDCAMKRKATYLCLSKLGSQNLRMARPCPNNPDPRKNSKEFHQRAVWREAKVEACDERKKKKEKKRVSPVRFIGLGLGGRREESVCDERGTGLGV
jgi:hypothetical protein